MRPRKDPATNRLIGLLAEAYDLIEHFDTSRVDLRDWAKEAGKTLAAHGNPVTPRKGLARG
jgi:hypothetical protein